MSSLRYKYDRFAYYAGKPVDALESIMGISRDDHYRMKYLIAGLPVIGSTMNALDNTRYMDDYISNRGLSWSDKKYWTSGATGIGSTVNFVSSNIKRLYQ